MFVAGVEIVEFEVAEVFDVDHLVAGFIDGSDELVELEIDGAGIAVLRVLDEEDHQKSDNGGAGIDDELPGVGVVEDRSRRGPDDDDGASDGEGPFGAHAGGGLRGEASKPVAGGRGGLRFSGWARDGG